MGVILLLYGLPQLYWRLVLKFHLINEIVSLTLKSTQNQPGLQQTPSEVEVLPDRLFPILAPTNKLEGAPQGKTVWIL